MSLFNIDDVSKKENDKKSKSMVATPAGVWDMQRIFGVYLWTIPCRYWLIPDHWLNLPCRDSLQELSTDQYLSEYARAEKKSGE